MVFKWFFHGFFPTLPMVFPGFSNEFPHVFPPGASPPDGPGNFHGRPGTTGWDPGLSSGNFRCDDNQVSMDWFKGKSTGNHGFYHQK